ncbi:MAG: hypothetical protein U5K72_06135 [Balneolaceae bacterium]|nr:hypothetical protein [Balneolaceae bacterium]
MGQWVKLAFSAFLLAFGAIGQISAQSSQEEPNRLSIGIMGAVTTGHLDLGSAFQSSVDANFEFQERLNNTLGFNIRYVATPEIALQTNVVFGKFSFLSDIFPDDALTFNNNYVTTSLTTQLSLVRIFGASAKNFNLFGSFGTGLMFNDVSIDSEAPEIMNSDVTPADHPFSNFFTTFGGGIRFNLGNRIDSYAQYEYSSASRDIIDGNFIGELLNLGGSSEISNSWSAVTFGIQFKFGSSSVDADWPTVSRVIAPEPPPERDMFERLEELLARQSEMFQEEIDELSGRIDSLELALLEEKQRNEQLAEQLEEQQDEEAPQNEEMAEQIRELQQQVAELESALAAEQTEEQQPTIAEETRQPADAAKRDERPRTKAIQRVRVQGEMLGVRQLPQPLPVEIVLVPDAPEEIEEADALTQIVEESQVNPEQLDIAEPESEEFEEITKRVQSEKDVSFEDETIEPEPLTDTIFEATPEAEPADEMLADAEVEEPGVEEKQEDVFERADSLRVVDSIEELDSTSQGMAHVRDDVTRPDTADLEVPKPEEKDPVQPDPDQEQPQPDEEVTPDDSEEIASADIEPDQPETQTDTDGEIDEQIAQADTDTTDAEMEESQIQQDATQQQMDAAEQPGKEGMNWTWYALIAVAVLGAVYFVANMFRSKSDSDSE